MYYILDSRIALRSWWFVPYASYTRNSLSAHHLKKEEFDFLSRCDGKTDIEADALAKSLCEKGLCHPVEKGTAEMTEWQKPKTYNNRYMPSMNWMITGRCNYNCIHCFNASDNTPLQSEFSMAEADKLMDEARDCGINSFTITGGEPMLHKRFMDIIKGIYSREMHVFELNTNGHYITQDILEEMKKIGCRPLIKISFDGIGYHDRMRGCNGAEEDTMRAIKLCIDNDFDVGLQIQINRLNRDSILPTLKVMDDLGVKSARVIRTSESPRWELNAPGQSLSVIEYYNDCLHIAGEYMKDAGRMSVNFWQFLYVYPDQAAYRPNNFRIVDAEHIGGLSLCRTARNMIAVASDGNVYPCMQMSGWCTANGINYGNVKKDSLQSILQYSPYMKEICTTVDNLIQKNENCRKCVHLPVCGGGCRVLAQLTDGNLTGCDRTKCLYFGNGYPQKIKNVLSGYRDISEY